MRRSILTSFVVIGAVLALVVGAGTFAVFTDTDDIAGTVGAGTLQVVLQDGNPVNQAALSFEMGTDACPALADGESCTTTVEVIHDTGSNLEFSYTGTLAESGDTADDCFSAALSSFANSNTTTAPASNTTPLTNNGTQETFSHAEGNAPPDATDALDPSETDSMTLTVTLGGPNACQGVGPVTYTVTVNATQSSTPHD